MDRNFLLAFALSMMVITLWMSLQPKPDPLVEDPAASAPLEAAQAPEAATPPGGALPAWEPAPVPAATETEAPFGSAPPSAPPSARPAEARTVTVTTDLVEVDLQSVGGTLSRYELKEYRDSNAPGARKVALVRNQPGLPAALATPFGQLGLGDWSSAPFSVEQPDPYTVKFHHTRGGVTVTKTYRFEPGRYDFTLALEVQNGTNRTLEPIYEAVWPAVRQDTTDFEEFSLVGLHDEDLKQLLITGRGTPGCGGGGSEQDELIGNVHWAGAQTRYFLAAMIPEVASVSSARFVPQLDGEIAVTTIGQRKVQLAPGVANRFEYRVYVGPKETDRFAEGTLAAAQLDRSVQLGWSWIAPLARFFSWLLHQFYAYIPNYGVVIILITILMRIVTAPLLSRQMRSMKKMSTQMQALKPKLDEIKEKYGNDREKMSQETMNAYREAGVNPLGMLGGCLPLLLQFPVFIGLFYALQSEIELRQAPFFGWIDDLSVPEALLVIPGLELPLRVLPLVMGATMFLQQKLTPQTSMDPAQQQMMMVIMPVMFTVLFYQFPSGLVLYWMVSNVLAIAHQAWINRTPEPA